MVDDWIMKLVERRRVLLWSADGGWRWKIPEWSDLSGKMNFEDIGWSEFRDVMGNIRESLEARGWFMS